MNAKACRTAAERAEDLQELLGKLSGRLVGEATTHPAGYVLTKEEIQLVYALGIQNGWGRGYPAGKGERPMKKTTRAHGKMVPVGTAHGEGR